MCWWKFLSFFVSGNVFFQLPPPPPPFPNRILLRQYIWRLAMGGRHRSYPPRTMLLLLARHVDLELSFGSSSNQPSTKAYCSEKKRSWLFLLAATVQHHLQRTNDAITAQLQRDLYAATWSQALILPRMLLTCTATQRSRSSSPARWTFEVGAQFVRRSWRKFRKKKFVYSFRFIEPSTLILTMELNVETS